MDPLNFTPTDRWRRAHEAARVIEEARQLAVPKLPQHEAASRAGLSPTYWPVIIRGWRLSGGVQAPVTPPDDTLRRMARAVDAEREVMAVLAEVPDEPGDGVPSNEELRAMSTEDLIRWGMEIARRWPDDPAIQKGAELLAALAEQQEQSKKTG